MRHLVWFALWSGSPAFAEEAAPSEPSEETVDALESLDTVFEALATFIHIDGDAIELGDGLYTYDGGQRVTWFDEWLVFDGDDVSVGHGWFAHLEGRTIIAGWTLPAWLSGSESPE